MRRALALLSLVFALAALPAMAEPAKDAHAPADSHAAESHGDDDHGEGSHGPPLLAKLVNTLIFFGLLGWFAGPWIAAQLRTRKAQIATDLSAAQRAREEAEAQLARIEARLAEVDGEVDAILANAGKQAEAEKERIVAAATVEAERIVEQAESQVGELESQASRRLRGQAADLAVELARDLVTKELADGDRSRLFDDYLDGLDRAGH